MDFLKKLNPTHMLIGILVILVIGYAVLNLGSTGYEGMENQEHDEEHKKKPSPHKEPIHEEEHSNDHEEQKHNVEGMENENEEEEHYSGMGSIPAQVGSDVSPSGSYQDGSCYPQATLKPSELMPQGATEFSELYPTGQGNLQDKNFIQAGFHSGIDTVGQTLRNPNLQLRSEPPNPQVVVSPWGQPTINPDMNRRAFEIGGGGC